MAIDFTRYQPPGVYTEAVPGPQIGVRSSVPTAIGIFGLTRGYRVSRESVLINPDVDEDTPAANKTLSQLGIITASVAVVNPITGATYTVGTDYTIDRVNAGPDAAPNTQDDLYTIKRVIDGGHIEPGETVTLTYRYTDPQYYNVYVFYDYDDVRDAYGDPYDDDGNLQSELSLMAEFAFDNGAFQIVTAAVEPEDPEAVTMGDYADALDKFRDEELISIVCSSTGAQPIQELVRQHVSAQSNNKYERTAILGMDGTVNAISTNTRMSNAQAITDKRVVLISPASFQYFSPALNKEIALGGQYMAAAVAGTAVSNISAMPLTRNIIRGFKDVTEKQREGEKNLETQNGLCVVEKTRRQFIQVRHGVTTDPTDIHTAEYNIIRQADHMVYRIRDYLDNDGLIGQPIYDITLINVKASAESALQSLVRDGIIAKYRDLKVRQLQSNPDVIEVRYGWRPAYPLNYIVVRYGIDLTSGDVTTLGGTTSNSGFNDGNTLNSA